MSDTSTFKTAQSMDPDTPRKLLSVVKDFEMLGAVDVEFDDVRVYRGQVSRATFLDAYRCGHRPLCAKRAHATPASRRVVCASAVIATKNEETYLDYFCTAAMYYDGAAIDVSAKLDTSGVTFTYRDTSWEESSFEMLRKPVGDEFSSASYETIIQMDGDLKGCVNKFSSISYLDREAGNKPNLEWYYKVRTKMASASSSDLVSTTHYFKAPWIGTLEGTVTAGSSGTPVAHVRVCADFAWPNGTAMSSTVHKSSGDLALYMRTEHSSNMTRTASEKTYVVTDGDPDPRSGASSLNPGEYVRVELARWSSIERVEVCMSGQVSSSQRLRAYVQDYDSGDSGNHGHECTFNAELTMSHARHTCMFYDCVGSKLTSFHGKFINVVRDGESSSDAVRSSISVSEISAVGTRTNCRFSAVSDADGAYEIKLRDTSGKIPVKAKMLAAAYKEEIFPKTVKKVIDSADTSSPTSQPAKVLLVVRQSDGNASAAANSSSGQSVESFESWDGDDSTSLSFGEFTKFVEDAAGFPLKGHAIISRAVWSSLDVDGDDVLSRLSMLMPKRRCARVIWWPIQYWCTRQSTPSI